MTDNPQSIFEHLKELRTRIIRAVIALVIGVVIAFIFSRPFMHYILGTAVASGEVTLVQLTFADSFLAEFRLSIIGGLVLASPVVLFQLIAFILPALRSEEKRLLWIGLPFATLMFIAGWSFGWFVVVPVTKEFFLSVSNQLGVTNQVTPSGYISFVLSICNPLGLAFQLPLIVLVLARLGLVTAPLLGRVRKFAFLGIMILAAVLSPPDVVSMSIFMVPLYGLYEFSILLAKVAGKRRPV